MTTRHHIRPWASVRSAFELTVLAALPAIPWAANESDIRHLADRTGRTSRQVMEDALAGDTIAWTVEGIWVCLGCASDDYGAQARTVTAPLPVAA